MFKSSPSNESPFDFGTVSINEEKEALEGYVTDPSRYQDVAGLKITRFDSYLAARIINGFFCSVGQEGALMWVKDLFFYHEHPRVINYIEFFVILSPYLGPLVISFIVLKTTWRWRVWICTILVGISWFFVFFLDETYIDRISPMFLGDLTSAV